MKRYRYSCMGLGIAVISIVLDQLVKWWMVDVLHISEQVRMEVTPFFNLVLVWNHGVSFGMFSDHNGNAAVALIAVALAIVLILLVWLYRVTQWWIALAIGLVIGGAIGNVIDRIRFGAVIDFLDFHLYGQHWPAFNVADASIFCGVALLLWDSFFCSKPSVAKAGDSA